MKAESSSVGWAAGAVDIGVEAAPISLQQVGGKLFALLKDWSQTQSPLNGLYELDSHTFRATPVLLDRAVNQNLIALEVHGDELLALAQKSILALDAENGSYRVVAPASPHPQGRDFDRIGARVLYVSASEKLAAVDLETGETRFIEPTHQNKDNIVSFGFLGHVGDALVCFVPPSQFFLMEFGPSSRRAAAVLDVARRVSAQRLKLAGECVWMVRRIEVPVARAVFYNERGDEILSLDRETVYDFIGLSLAPDQQAGIATTE